MSKKTATKNSQSIEKVFQESQVMALLERLEDSIKLIAENQVATNERVDKNFLQMKEGFSRMDERFSRMDERFFQMDKRFSRMDERLLQMEKKADENFSLIMTCLSNIEDETMEIKAEIKKLGETKVDKSQWELLLGKVTKIEQELERQKNIINSLQSART